MKQNQGSELAKKVVMNYFSFFNQKKYDKMLELIDENVIHEVNQGKERYGKSLFSDFLKHMEYCYDENLTEIMIFESNDPDRFAVEFKVNGIYKNTDQGLPVAKNQNYSLPAASFITVRNQKIIKVVTYYNLPKWIELVSL